ncbi:cyclic nucleotide-binding domain-containing protein [Rudanella paleaurantiibacter]|uniref:Cyclic nucleotide-binding domain-containing protein n=1 Tax=Rudanella paleaurantiibacter TaxID=2614655 RepID=A0A7J5TXQ3_9BACT|nr:Crp/Fnr family transcriptional regulator [Rudanella paleaurantiibacter]KAB7728351.1 cyclic nucleotide-binding domain-containing protein [Rudanella paleaurantiibacter]
MSPSQQTILHHHLHQFAQLTETDLYLADPLWQSRIIPRQGLFTFSHSVCRHVGFVLNGIFRVYYIDPKTEQEHNLYFVAEHTFLTSLKSLLTQTTCPYLIEALEDTELLVIEHDRLRELYTQSHGWERFGRLLAEHYFLLNQTRSESLLTQSAEERYVDLLTRQPDILNRVSLGHIASYLGIKGPSLSRIRAQVAHR